MNQSNIPTHIYAVTDLRQNLTHIMERLSRNEKIFIARHSQGVAVMLSMDTYNGICDAKEEAEQAVKSIELELLNIEKELLINPDSISARRALTQVRASITKITDK